MKANKITILKKSFFLLILCLFPSMISKLAAQADPQQVTKETFKGKMALDIRDSKSDWAPYLPKKAPAGAPNILFILYDDTGMAAWSPYGGAINMPTMQKLADNGITYSQWHTTALCSPTRSTLLQGAITT
jgi:arylsulfatase